MQYHLVKEKQISASFIYKGVKFVVCFIKVNCFLQKLQESLLIVVFKEYSQLAQLRYNDVIITSAIMSLLRNFLFPFAGFYYVVFKRKYNVTL